MTKIARSLPNNLPGSRPTFKGSTAKFNVSATSPVVVQIEWPADGDKISASGTEVLRASASQGTVDLSSQIQWESSVDGDLGPGEALAVLLSAGGHTLTAAIVDSTSGAKIADDVVTVEADPGIYPCSEC